MSEERSSNLSFHVKESVWFNRGQEVDNLVSIELEPDICIQENANYISIVGSLKLTGEYYTPEMIEEREPIDSYREEPLLRTVDYVNEVEEGLYALEHRFPVDITIPREKVADLENIYVLVDSFDYDILQANRLQLSADIEISGLIQEERVAEDEQEQEEVVEEVVDEVEEPEEAIEEVEEATEPIVNDEPRYEEEQVEEVIEEEIEEEASPAFELEVRKEPVEELQEEEEVEEEIREEPMTVEVKSRPEEALFPSAEVEPEREEETFEVAEVEESEVEQPEVEETIEEPVSQDDHLEKVKTHTRDDNALYLTTMLTQENEGFTKVRMRIIQEGDSLDSIAENYAVPVTQILRENRMDSGEIEEGQILYIPVTSGKQ